MPDIELKTRRSLIERLRNRDDRESWREFFNHYWKLMSLSKILRAESDDSSSINETTRQ